jgi:hypothetical protein
MSEIHTICRWLAVACVTIAFTCARETRAEVADESLGSQLLDDLDPNQFAPPAAAPAPAATPPSRPKRILPGLTDDALGEDLGRPSAGGPLVEVKRKMETAESLLRGGDSVDRAGPVQQQVVAELDALIEQLAKQCSSSSSQSNGQPKPGSQRSQSANSQQAARPGRGTAPARDSTSQIQRDDSQAVQFADREGLHKNLWGHLPPHIREQMLQAHSDEFLPQYELEIEEYFRRLAEEPGDRQVD